MKPTLSNLKISFMNKKEFYLVAVVVVFIYLAFIFQVNLNNFINFQKNPYAEFSFNIFPDI